MPPKAKARGSLKVEQGGAAAAGGGGGGDDAKDDDGAPLPLSATYAHKQSAVACARWYILTSCL